MVAFGKVTRRFKFDRSKYDGINGSNGRSCLRKAFDFIDIHVATRAFLLASLFACRCSFPRLVGEFREGKFGVWDNARG